MIPIPGTLAYAVWAYQREMVMAALERFKALLRRP